MNHHPDRSALEAIYSTTDGANWCNSSQWLTDAPLNEWHGVTTDRGGRVLELDLASNRLTGIIPAELAQLTNLKTLNLSLNRLKGPITTALARLVNLQTLEIGRNKLTGDIPVELAQLGNLRTLKLWANRLEGPVPTELAQLATLETLELWGNGLTGSRSQPSWRGSPT